MPRRRPENKTIEVILLQHDKHLWEKYEVVRVAPIFAKNILLPKEIAVLATPDSLHRYKTKMEQAQESLAKKKTTLEWFFAKLQQEWGLQLVKQANEKNALYEKVDALTIANAIEEQYWQKLDVSNIKLKKRIQLAWEYKVWYKYKDLEKSMTIIIKAEQAKQIAEKAKTLAEEATKTEEAKV